MYQYIKTGAPLRSNLPTISIQTVCSNVIRGDGYTPLFFDIVNH